MYKPEYYIQEGAVLLRNEYPKEYSIRTALGWSIMIWELIANNIESVGGIVDSGTDPLCDKLDGSSDCPNCPISKYYDEKSCNSSPEYVFATAASAEDYKKAEIEAKHMVAVLGIIRKGERGEVLFMVWKGQ